MEQPNPSQHLSPDSEIARLREAIAELQSRVNALERGSIVPRPLAPAVEEPDTFRKPDEVESRLGLTFVNRIGAVTLAVGIIFFFKYAADNQWIGSGGLVVLGLLAGVALIGAGEWLRRRNQQAFAQGVAGCGFAILYISVYASFGYYKLIPREAGFFGLVAASAFAIALCFRFASPAIAAVGFIGAFLAPLLVRSAGDDTPPWLYFAYLTLLSIVSVLTVMRLYRVLGQKSALFLVPFNAFWLLLLAWLLIENHHPGGFALFAFVFAVVHLTAAFAARLTPAAYGVFYVCAHACFAIAALRVLDLWTTRTAAPANRNSILSEIDSVFLAVYGVVAITYGALRKSAIDRLLGLALLCIVVFKLYFYDVWLLTRGYRISAFVALGVLLLAASYVYSRFKSRSRSGIALSIRFTTQGSLELDTNY